MREDLGEGGVIVTMVASTFGAAFDSDGEAERTDWDLPTSAARSRQPPAGFIQGQEAERSRLARELHDDVSQRLTLLGVNLHR